MKTYTNKDLFEKALGYFTSNADEIIDDVWDNDDWSEVILWKPFENWEVNDIHDQVSTLQSDFIEIRDSKTI